MKQVWDQVVSGHGSGQASGTDQFRRQIADQVTDQFRRHQVSSRIRSEVEEPR
jgi:hypothetical protein